MHCVAPSFLHQFYISISSDIVGGAITCSPCSWKGNYFVGHILQSPIALFSPSIVLKNFSNL